MRILFLADTTTTQSPHPISIDYNDSSSAIPKYAILSHTWDDLSEVTLQELSLFDQHVVYSRNLKLWQIIISVLVLLGAGLYFVPFFNLDEVSLYLATPTAYALVVAFCYLAIYFHSLPTERENGKSALFFKQKQPGYAKIQQACMIARSRGIHHAWVDTCCIDKTSSAELTESINSMYDYYARSEECYVYLCDLEPTTTVGAKWEEAFKNCRWFTRGWTLQELIAPKRVIFFDREWNECGTKDTLSGLLSEITEIPVELLEGRKKCGDYAVARRMSWASKRVTTREEDTAYCLLGIFDVRMSLLYGEGMEAFQRLQKVVLESTVDRSIFIWTETTNTTNSSWSAILAKSPRSFECARNIEASLADSVYRDLTIGPRGIQMVVSLIYLFRDVDKDDGNKCVLDTFCATNGQAVGVMIRKVSGGRYVRYKPWKLAWFKQGPSSELWRDMNRTLVETATFATKLETVYPFSAGNDPVLGNRHSALKLRLDPSMSQFTVDQCRTVPRTHWDIHDNVFIATNSTSKAWCGFFVHGHLNHTPTTCIPINLFVGCIRWNIKRPFTILASLEDLDPGFRASLEWQLDMLEFESCRKAEAAMMSVLDGRVGETRTVVETSVVDRTQLPSSNDGGTVFSGQSVFQTNGPATSSPAWHYRVPSTGEKVRVEVNLELDQEEDGTICVNPVTILNLRLKLME
ncbi:Putative Vegetative incompatibility protein [Podospora comata]|uniref:Vegetative incompatibility protein n=1 Tax=Podospora comata TaxID=48703 RepID=A0ABY6SE70_PODCO|nr:Putative Vegetative incompatibility protein [Podospora comata]